MVDTVQSIAQLTAFFKEEREKDRVEAEKQRIKDREANKEALDVIGEDRKLLGEKKQELKDQRESLKKRFPQEKLQKLNQQQQAAINKKLGMINKKEEELQKQFKENIKKAGEQAEKNRKDEQKRSQETRKEAAGAGETLKIQQESIARREEQLDKDGKDTSKDEELVQAKIQLLKDETDLKNQGLTELQQRRNNQEANRKILEMEGRNAEINKKFQKDERKLQRAELKDRLSKATSGSERKELLKEQSAKDRKSLSVFNKIELGVRGLGETFKDKFKGMASAGAGLLKKGALIALLFLLPKILNSKAAKSLVKLIQDKVIPTFKRIAGFFDKIFGEGTGGLVATLGAIGLVLYGPSVIKLLFKAAKGLVGAVMSLLSDSTTALGTDTKGRGRGRGKGRGKLSRLGRILGKGGGRGISVAANATKTVGKTIAKGASAAASKAAGILKVGSKIGLGALKFAGPVGLAVTAGLGVFDGVQAGMESFKKDGKVGKAIQEGTAGLLSSLTLGAISQEQISGGMSKIGNFFKRRQKYGAGADDYEKVDLQANKQNELAMNKSELLRFTQDPEAYMEEVNKGRGKGGKGRKLSPIQVRNQLLDNIKSNKRDLKDLGLSGGTLETTGSMMDSNLMQLKTTGMTAEQIIQQGMSDRSKGIKDTAPIIINNDSSVRSNSTTNANVNETITHRDGLMVSATSDF